MSGPHRGIIPDWSKRQVTHRQCVGDFLKGVKADTRLQARINMCLAAKACAHGVDNFRQIYAEEYESCKIKILKTAREKGELE